MPAQINVSQYVQVIKINTQSTLQTLKASVNNGFEIYGDNLQFVLEGNNLQIYQNGQLKTVIEDYSTVFDDIPQMTENGSYISLNDPVFPTVQDAFTPATESSLLETEIATTSSETLAVGIGVVAGSTAIIGGVLVATKDKDSSKTTSDNVNNPVDATNTTPTDTVTTNTPVTNTGTTNVTPTDTVTTNTPVTNTDTTNVTPTDTATTNTPVTNTDTTDVTPTDTATTNTPVTNAGTTDVTPTDTATTNTPVTNTDTTDVTPTDTATTNTPVTNTDTTDVTPTDTVATNTPVTTPTETTTPNTPPNETLAAKIVNIAANSPTVNEGDIATFNVTLSNNNGGSVTWRTSGSAENADYSAITFSDNVVLNGETLTIPNGVSQFTASYHITADNLTDPNEMLTVSSDEQSASIQINDTSTTPTPISIVSDAVDDPTYHTGNSRAIESAINNSSDKPYFIKVLEAQDNVGYLTNSQKWAGLGNPLNITYTFATVAEEVQGPKTVSLSNFRTFSEQQQKDITASFEEYRKFSNLNFTFQPSDNQHNANADIIFGAVLDN